MEANEHSVKLYYNTEREKLKMPEYGRNILIMVEQLKAIEDRAKRSEQARAVVKSMEILYRQRHSQDKNIDKSDEQEHKFWDHLYLIAGLDLDIDSPYPAPTPEELYSKPEVIPLKNKPVKATHYGRNIESIIDLIASESDGEVKTAMIRSLAIYMRQQYLIWNKDSVADSTIFQDIEKLSDYRIKVLEGLSLSKISESASFARPSMSINVGGTSQNGGQNGGQNRNWKQKNRRANNRKK